MSQIQQHYQAGRDDATNAPGLAAQVEQTLQSEAWNALSPTEARLQLAALDQFHVGGLAATEALVEMVGIAPDATVLEAGAGLGGSARHLAQRTGCRVIGVDITPSFVAVARLLTQRLGQSDSVSFQVGDLLNLPFPDGHFDAVWTQHVAMNIADREALYREFRRVLKPGGKLALHDVVAVENVPAPHYPVPWAQSSATSFLLTRQQTFEVLERNGFAPAAWNDVTEAALRGLQQARSPIAPALSLATVMGPRFAEMTANLARNAREGRIQFLMGVWVAGEAL